MLNILNFFKKNDNQNNPSEPNKTEVENTKTWFEERYEIALIQRNVLVVIAIFCLVAVSVSVIGIAKISLSKEFDPFVIQIDDSTGVARVVNPISLDVLSGKEELSKYFMKKYLIARETYNPADFDTYAQKVVRLMSSPAIYGTYLNYIRNKDHDPTIIYGQKNTTSLTVKSWSRLEDGHYIVRFSINENAGGMKVYHKIAVMDFEYTPMTLTEDERDVNPVGFQVKSYRVDDDNS